MKPILSFMAAATILLLGLAGCSSGGNTASPSQHSQMGPSSTSRQELESEAGSINDGNANVSIDKILMAIEAAYGDQYPANTEIPSEILESEFGLSPRLYEEVKGEMAMISAHNDRVVVAQAAPGKADELEQALLDARRRMVEDSLQYPANIPKTNAAKVARNGDYVAFLLIGVPNETIEDIESEQARQYAEEQVQIAVQAFHGVFEP